MLNELLADHRTGQDETQLGSFVLGGRTPWGTYKQALRELYKRIRGLRQAITDRDLLLIDIEETKEKAYGQYPMDLDARRKEVQMRQAHGRLEEIERSIRDTTREAALFYRVAKELKNELGEIDDAKRAELDREEWKWWILKRAACMGPDEVVTENLISLPTEERLELLAIIKNQDEIQAIVEKSEYGRRELPAPTPEEIKLIEEETSK